MNLLEQTCPLWGGRHLKIHRLILAELALFKVTQCSPWPFLRPLSALPVEVKLAVYGIGCRQGFQRNAALHLEIDALNSVTQKAKLMDECQNISDASEDL